MSSLISAMNCATISRIGISPYSFSIGRFGASDLFGPDYYNTNTILDYCQRLVAASGLISAFCRSDDDPRLIASLISSYYNVPVQEE